MYTRSYSVSMTKRFLGHQTRHSCQQSGGENIGGEQGTVQVEVIVDHSLRSKTVAGTRVGAIGIGMAHRAVGIELAQNFSQTAGIVGAEVKSGIAPDFAKAGN